MAKTRIEAYVEESSFVDKEGQNVKFLRLVIPVTDTTEKHIKVEQFVLQLALDRANNNPFKK